MAQMNREQLKEKIKTAEAALMFAGPIHRKDLQKHIRRMRAELAQYDRFQAAARQGVG